ncbi:hypothetical protein G6F40_014548 [Rhizopus arrhizus]|nr:hypothetical protein G6F40_014548 [Rhizopus arrhizus]
MTGARASLQAQGSAGQHRSLPDPRPGLCLAGGCAARRRRLPPPARRAAPHRQAAGPCTADRHLAGRAVQRWQRSLYARRCIVGHPERPAGDLQRPPGAG